MIVQSRAPPEYEKIETGAVRRPEEVHIRLLRSTVDKTSDRIRMIPSRSLRLGEIATQRRRFRRATASRAAPATRRLGRFPQNLQVQGDHGAVEAKRGLIAHHSHPVCGISCSPQGSSSRTEVHSKTTYSAAGNPELGVAFLCPQPTRRPYAWGRTTPTLASSFAIRWSAAQIGRPREYSGAHSADEPHRRQH